MLRSQSCADRSSLRGGLLPPLSGHSKSHSTVFILLKGVSYENGQQQSHVSTTEDGKKHSIDHEQDVGRGQRGQQVDEAAEDQVGFVVVVFVEEVLVCHPARDELSDGFCNTCKKERAAGMNTIEERSRALQYSSQMERILLGERFGWII